MMNDRYTQDINLLYDVYRNAKIVKTGEYYTTINEFTDQIPALRPEVLWIAAKELIAICDFGEVDKIVTEEDKGAPLATVVSLLTGLPLAVARWYSYDLPDEVTHKIDSEYFRGNLYLNGLKKGERVLLIEDTISTGGTIVALAEAVRQSGCEIKGIGAVVEN